MPQIVNYEITKGDTKYWRLTFTDANDVVINIIDYIVYFTLKRNRTDSDDDALIKKDIGPGKPVNHSDPTNGITKISLTSEDTDIDADTYYYDMQYKKPNGDIVTLAKGYIEIASDVTERTT